jgi:hypothetical protein
MKSPVSVVPAAVLATAIAVAILAAQVGNRSRTLDPGFVPNTGQINTGHAVDPWSDAPPQQQPLSQEEARAALMMPDDCAPSVGQGSVGQTPGERLTTTNTSIFDITAGTAAQSAPIGSTTQTMPAKFSQRNDLLDRVPTTAWPLPLNEQQRQQIYAAIMADNSQPAPGATELKPGSLLSFDQARDLHALPQAVAGIDGLHGLKYLKGKNEALLVRPPNGYVVDEITPEVQWAACPKRLSDGP